MYNYIIGTVVDTAPNKIVIENNNIGYEMGVSGNTLFDVNNIGQQIKIYTYLYVREDIYALYGFSKANEKIMFLKLIDISGVGPKMAMQILGGYDLKTLTVAIATGDTATLCKIKGLGKKTAELIVLHLKDHAVKDVASVGIVGAGFASDEISDAVFALVSLGVTKTDALRACQDIARTTSGVENIITKALQILT